MSRKRKAKRSQHQDAAPPRAVPHAPSAPGIKPTSRRHILLAAIIIIVAGAIVYSNSLDGPFILDDRMSIVENPYIRTLWPITEPMRTPPVAAPARPMVTLTLAVNYAIGGYDVTSYHVTNIIIHILGALALFGVIRRTLQTDLLKGTFAEHSAWLALICALIWIVHPLQTQAVNYVIQRAESMMGMLYIFTLYCVIRGATSLKEDSSPSSRSIGWYLLAIATGAIGMGTKEVMVTVPIVVFIYDRVFLARSFGEIFRRRWWVHAGLAATCVIVLLLQPLATHEGSAGFGNEKIFTPALYAQTQCGVIWRYFRLCFWPSPLVLDYHWPRAYQFSAYALPGAGVLALLAATVAAFRFKPELGFCGAWFFLILGPTSSFMPINDPIFEHRMYLPLAAIIAIVILTGYHLASRRGGRSTAAALGCLLAVAIIASLGYVTYLRNADYSTAFSIWKDTTEKWDSNPRAHNSLGSEYQSSGDNEKALEHFNKAVERGPKYTPAYSNRAGLYVKLGKYDLAMADAAAALRIDPKRADAYNIRGVVYEKTHRYAEAIGEFNQAVKLQPNTISFRRNRAVAYRGLEQFDKAIADYTEAIRLDPGDVLSYTGRGNTYSVLGRHDKAIADYSMTISIQPDEVANYYLRSRAYKQAGEFADAIADYGKVIQLQPNSPTSWNERGKTYGQAGKWDLAIADFDRAIQLNPDYIYAYSNRGMAHSGKGDYEAGIGDFTIAIRLDSSNPSTYFNRAGTYEKANRLNEALADYTRALELSPDVPQGHYRLGLLLTKMNRSEQARAVLIRALQLARAYRNTQLSDQIQQELNRLGP